jgi:hypothetical protein
MKRRARTPNVPTSEELLRFSPDSDTLAVHSVAASPRTRTTPVLGPWCKSSPRKIPGPIPQGRPDLYGQRTPPLACLMLPVMGAFTALIELNGTLKSERQQEGMAPVEPGAYRERREAPSPEKANEV